MTKPIIKLENIDITFYQKRRTIEAVKDVSITINKGNIYGIVGYSGAGKSTLVRTINLLQPPTSGTITIGDDVTFSDGQVQLKGAKLRQKRQKIGMIFQHFNLMAQKRRVKMWLLPLDIHLCLKKKKTKSVGIVGVGRLVRACRELPVTIIGWSKTACGDCACLGK